jgi:hypothetical protein
MPKDKDSTTDAKPDLFAASDFEFPYNGAILQFKDGDAIPDDDALRAALKDGSAPLKD